jgi:hypothetical protein
LHGLFECDEVFEHLVDVLGGDGHVITVHDAICVDGGGEVSVEVSVFVVVAAAHLDDIRGGIIMSRERMPNHMDPMHVPCMMPS